MTGPTILLLPSAILDTVGRDVFGRVVGPWPEPSDRGTTASLPRHGKLVRIDRSGLSPAEFEATRRMLRTGGYRAVRDTGSGTRRQDRLVERTSVRLRRMLGRLARRIAPSRKSTLAADPNIGLSGTPGISGPADAVSAGALHARAMSWSMHVHGNAHAESAEGVDLLDLRIGAVRDGRIADADTAVRIDEAISALVALHAGPGEHLSCILPTPWSPARLSVADERMAGLVAGCTVVMAGGSIDAAWRTLEIDPAMAALMPKVVLVDFGHRADPDTVPDVVFRPVHRIVRAEDRIDAMQALRIVERLARDPIA